MSDRKKPEKLKVGDRVALYCGGRVVTNITAVFSSDGTVRTDHSGASVVHPKQCRRLVKKPRRRVWVSVKSAPGIWPEVIFEDPTKSDHYDAIEWTEFAEVKGKR